MKLLVQLNEGPGGCSGYMSVYVCLMKSDRNETVTRPITKRYTSILVEQQDDTSQWQNIEESVNFAEQDSFVRLRQRENLDFRLFNFVKHSTLRTRQCIRDHVVYIKIVINP